MFYLWFIRGFFEKVAWRVRLTATSTLWCLAVLFMPASVSASDAIDFSRDIRPILSNRCYACHGPDQDAREADLRFDARGELPRQLVERSIIVPGDPAASLLLRRVASDDPTERMPPADSDPALPADEQQRLEQWIREGARFDAHWAFLPIEQPALPDVASDWARNGIDPFVLAGLQEVGLEPAAEAPRAKLIRRVYVDLLGLPPPLHEVRRFLADPSPVAYEAMVERAFSDPHFGERWGRHWLDQARYADTNGYTVDSERSIWPYRDWVIRAINADMPFDQFTIEQLAGDLLPNPSVAQLVATGFHRNTLINQEGGTDAEQFRNEAVVDRVNTTGAVWLGLTVGCGQCHDHKFDPVTQRDYYRLFAFFNSQEDVNTSAPTIQLPTVLQRLRMQRLDERIEKLGPGSDDERRGPDDPETGREADSLESELTQLRKDKQELGRAIPTSMIMRELRSPRETHLLIRGDFLREGDSVWPGVPEVLSASPLSRVRERATRLDLAKWLMASENPLTARVTVNRVWSHYFGRGLVETENDFGIQGTPPTHPELLDWLSAECIRHGWSMKHLHRLIVNSATYRQSSHTRADLASADPLNKLLGRQNRLRVDAEIVRDLSLAVAGLMDSRIGGRSVYPPQPDGVYAFTQRQAKWPTSAGADRYRRGLYTFFMRSAPYPMLTTFDTPRFNTTCTLRTRSNTPLQSLTMANDEAMMECARALGRRIHEVAAEDTRRVAFAYELCLARMPEQRELTRLVLLIRAMKADFTSDLDAAAEFLGDSKTSSESIADVAACTALARVVLNLDEFIVRE